MEKDWRYDMGKNLKNCIFVFKKYEPIEENNDHDHCEFCGEKFSLGEIEGLKEGYLNIIYSKTGKKQGRWVCKKCFADFQNSLDLKVE